MTMLSLMIMMRNTIRTNTIINIKKIIKTKRDKISNIKTRLNKINPINNTIAIQLKYNNNSST